MYKILPIGGKEYKLEYTVEASLYDDCIEKLITFLGNTVGSAAELNIPENATQEESEAVRQRFVKQSIAGISNLPATALSVFYAGLLEHHGASGDNTVRSKNDAKNLVKQYFNDHIEDGTDTLYDIILICLEQMGEDGFFKRTGLEKLVTQSPKKRPVKTPQDHKKAGAK